MIGRILLVEDDLDLGVTLQMFLEMHHFKVDVVRDAESALEALEVSPVDLLITDHQLPGMSGQGLAARLRGCVDPVPVVAFTGGDETEALQASGLFAGILRKPCEPLRLVQLIEKVLGHR